MPIMKGKTYMKLLKIDEKRCTYTLDGKKYNSISEISKDDILKMLYLIYENSEIELDKIESDEDVVNDVERVIYSSLYSKLESFIQNKANIKNQLDEEVKEIEEKYK